MEKKNSDKFYVTKYGPRYAVRYPDGLIRCIVKSESFADQISKELNHEKANKKISRTMSSKQNPFSKPVICVTTGEKFSSVKQAAIHTGLDVKTIMKDCDHITKSVRYPRPRFEWMTA